MNNEQKKHLLVYTKKLSKVLKIITPTVIFDEQLEGTSLGGYDPETNTIGVSHSATLMDALFILAHELRHVYQIKNGYFRYEEYLTTNNFLSKDQYNDQPEEVDANAFAIVVMETVIGAKSNNPLFITKSITDRKMELLNEYEKALRKAFQLK